MNRTKTRFRGQVTGCNAHTRNLGGGRVRAGAAGGRMTERSEIRGREIKGVRKDRAEGCKQTRTTGPRERERERQGWGSYF